MHFPRTNRRKIVVNMTALTDVVFLLLIFFMMTANFVHADSMEMTMPTAKEAKSLKVSPLVVRLDAQATLTLNGAPVDRPGLAREVGGAVRANRDVPIQVESSPEVEVESLVAVLDTIYQTGGRNITVMP